MVKKVLRLYNPHNEELKNIRRKTLRQRKKFRRLSSSFLSNEELKNTKRKSVRQKKKKTNSTLKFKNFSMCMSFF